MSELRFYQKELLTYSGGRGRLNLEPGGYRPAHDQDEVVERIGYSPDSDLENPTGSVFCVHGGGFYVPWNEVPEYMHLESVLKAESDPRPGNDLSGLRSGSKGGAASSTQGKSYSAFSEEDKELTEIFLRTYGESKRSRDMFKSVKGDPEPKGKERSLSPKAPEKREEFLLVDGYNVIFAWDELRELAEINIDSARARLMERLSNYQGYRKMNLILVFDAYKVAGNHGNVEKYHNIYVVYSKEAETADQYIAKTVSTISDKYNVTVATSDSLVQLIIFSKSAIRMSARELLEEVELAEREIRERYLSRQKDIKTRVGDLLE